MGSLALGELAGERMKVALEANSTEDEHDCFSDNTHFSHYYDAKGIENIYYGTYQRVDGSVIKGDSIAMLVKAKDPALAKATDKQFKQTMASMQALVDKAEAQQNAQKFDQMLGGGVESCSITEMFGESRCGKTQLSVEDNEITSLSGLSKLTSLMELYIGNNRIDDLKEVRFNAILIPF